MDIVYNKGRSGRTNAGVVKGGEDLLYMDFWGKAEKMGLVKLN